MPHTLKRIKRLTVRRSNEIAELTLPRTAAIICVSHSEQIPGILSEVEKAFHEAQPFRRLAIAQQPWSMLFTGSWQALKPVDFRKHEDLVSAAVSIARWNKLHFCVLPSIESHEALSLACDAQDAGADLAVFLQASELRVAVQKLADFGASDEDLGGRFTYVDRCETRTAWAALFVTRREPTRNPRPPVIRLGKPQRLTLDQYVQKIRLSIVDRWKGEERDRLLIGIQSVRDLRFRFRKRLGDYLRAQGARSTEAFCVLLPSGITELWMHVDVQRGEYYQIFRATCKEAHGFDYSKVDSGRYDLDHADNLKTAFEKNNTKYVLLTPVERSINRSWNAVERALAYDPFAGPEMQVASWFTLPRLLGIKAPSVARGKTIEAGLKRIRCELRAKQALCDSEAEASEEGLLEFARRVELGREKLLSRKNSRAIRNGRK